MAWRRRSPAGGAGPPTRRSRATRSRAPSWCTCRGTGGRAGAGPPPRRPGCLRTTAEPGYTPLRDVLCQSAVQCQWT
ncbi:hypothetical protein ONE63_006145 [Megalurothrips usitatus]|uniref:Uncharacterized protein n=1 Tax=Megalurothrips usitatus TaxID=439358 RepID=A0AAV7XSF7_9NEOP|nr:hypothetical protein ONE63_006145 [Megalurothrips usitatus]